MLRIKPNNWKNCEVIGLAAVYVILILNALVFKDSIVAVFSAFFGITYTMLAGKGNPKCYLFGIAGSGLYGWLSFVNALWGNLCLYLLYYIPMQMLGFYKWNKNLKEDKSEIVKNKLSKTESFVVIILTLFFTAILTCILFSTGDKSPIIDGITTVLSLTGMYLTVKRAIEQWVVWIIVNGLTSIMWINIVVSGEKVYSTAVMWIVYFIIAVYFYREWKKEVV